MVGACLSGSGGNRATATVPGQLEAVEVVDLRADGVAELVAGGTTAMSSIQEVLVASDGQLVAVTRSGARWGLVDGKEGDSPDGGAIWSSWGCLDVDGDGRREILVVRVVEGGGGATWTSEAFRLAGATATVVASDAGDVPAGEGSWEFADGRTPDC